MRASNPERILSMRDENRIIVISLLEEARPTVGAKSSVAGEESKRNLIFVALGKADIAGGRGGSK